MGSSMTNLMAWLQSERRLDGALLAHLGIKQAKHPSLGEVVAFPYRRSGEAYAAKFRTADKKWASTAGVSRGLYNADALSKDSDLPIVLTEGEIDCATVIQAGWLRAVSLPDGWSEQGNKRDCLIEAEELLRKSPCVIVAPAVTTSTLADALLTATSAAVMVRSAMLLIPVFARGLVCR